MAQKQHEVIWKCRFKIRALKQMRLALLNNVQTLNMKRHLIFQKKDIIMHKERKIVSVGTDNNELFHLASMLM